MLDLDKVGNAVCANTKATGKTIELENSENKREPYRVDIPTGCRREPKKKRRFCESCICEFAVVKQVQSCSSNHCIHLAAVEGCKRVQKGSSIQDLIRF